ncbi:MAG: ion transporter [Phycisphaeraceae bacterium]|nr:ion transporter [Phycisphaeraceae bacterium]
MLQRFVDSRPFQGGVLLVILLNAVLLGWETYSPSPAVSAALTACLWLFVAELAVKLAAAARAGTLGAFFRDGWNLFDVAVVAASFLPDAGAFSAILRVVRVLRVFRLVRAVPELRLIVTVLGRSLVSMKHITLLAAIVFYIYAVIGVHMFGPHLKEYASLHEALFTLFRVLTGDNWTDLRYAMADRPFAWKATAYHVSWIVISTFLLINLIVGAVINNYQEVQEVERARRHTLDASDQRLAELVAELDRILKARRANGPASPEA